MIVGAVFLQPGKMIWEEAHEDRGLSESTGGGDSFRDGRDHFG